MATLEVRRSANTTIADYLSLAKPRVVLLHLVTAATAVFLAAKGAPSGATLLFTLTGGGLVAGSANALNCYFDRSLDAMMPRTRRRPLPSGRLSPNQALSFSILTGASGLLVLTSFVSLVAAILALSALACYVLAYTLWLKRRTFWSTIAGSGAGAIPPLVGWVAVTGQIEATALVLFAIIWLWTPPHFWSLAIFRSREYAQAGIEALPPTNTARWIMVFSLLLTVATLLLAPLAGLGAVYLSMAVLLGSRFLKLAVTLNEQDNQAAKRLYFYSILYIMLLFVSMVADRAVHL